MVRKILVLLAAGLGVAALGLVSSMWDPPGVHASSGSGEFIIRCPMTGEVQRVDPIMAPGETAPHVHIFFGNPDGTDNVQPTSTYAQMNNSANKSTTTCQDSNDTAAYWAPEPFMPSPTSTTGCVTDPTGGYLCPYLPGCTPQTNGSGNYNCGTDTDSTIYIRAYYLTTPGDAISNQLPPGLIMVAGTPDATTPPSNDSVINWNCGANEANGVRVQSPESIWPYDCSQYENDPNLGSQGLVEEIDFPSCYNGLHSYPSPNGPGPFGDANVPGYFDPSLAMSNDNDLAYAPCTGNYDEVVPQLSMRIHYVGLWTVSDDGNTVYPSSCAQAQNLSEPCETENQAYGTTGAPTDIGLELSSTQTQGAPGPWYTAHADYWQTWQQGLSEPLRADPNTGTLNSLSYYCLVEDNSCGFIENNNYPPPPGS
jgi:hypothetical protein